MALENPIAKLFRRCADAVKERYGLSDDSTLDWRDMFAKIANISRSDVDGNCDGPVPLENYIDGMDVEDKLRYTLGQLPKAIRKRDFGNMNPAFGLIELREIPYYIINTWSPDSYITFHVVDKYGIQSDFSTPTDSRWSYMIDNNTNFTSVTASDGKTYVQYKYSGAFVYDNAGTYVSPNDTIIENTTYYSDDADNTKEFNVKIATSTSNTDTVTVSFAKTEIDNGITWLELKNAAPSKISISGTSVKYKNNIIYEPSSKENNAVKSSDTISTSKTYRTYTVTPSTEIEYEICDGSSCSMFTCPAGKTWAELRDLDLFPDIIDYGGDEFLVSSSDSTKYLSTSSLSNSDAYKVRYNDKVIKDQIYYLV